MSRTKTNRRTDYRTAGCRNNSPIQDYIHRDDQTQPFEMTPGFKPFTVFSKSCQQIWGRVLTNLLYFWYITSEVKQYYEALYLSYKPRKEGSISQFFETNCTSSIFRTINRGLLTKPFKKSPKSPIQPAGSLFWQAPNLQWELCQVFEWTLRELRFNITKNLLCLLFL